MVTRRARKGYGPRGTTFTELKAKDFADLIKNDLNDEIDANLNGFVRSVVNDLSNIGTGANSVSVSPVLTGFFASSWKASNTYIARTDKIKDFPRWNKIKKGNRKGFRDRLKPGFRPLIAPRHSVPTNFKVNQPVYIGNTVKYAPYALLSPKSNINAYLQGGATGVFSKSLNQKIDRFFTDKRPDIRVGAEPQGSKIGYLRQ
tara:strand:+ start:323 stop:928 length:606 start_codon:yes stop_codon:yes gene_type:complete